MLIKTLVENTTLSQEFGCEHGLSLYIETKDHKILFDVGASELFLHNAKKLDVDIANIDFLVISHGHYDHGGGLKTFFQENTKARVFLHHLAFGQHYAIRPNNELEFIGLDEKLKDNKQITFASDRFLISDSIHVFSNIPRRESPPKSNSGLLMEYKGERVEDDFAHEQNLVIEEDGKTLLVTGCAHNGIINILEHFHSLKGKMPDYVVGGFHLSSPSGENENIDWIDRIDRIGKHLLSTKGKFFTCHCTGIPAYERLKAIMGDKIAYLSVGSEITI
ncbi:MAG: MBL fold metallo-hydrolase [Desulfitobacterium sp.]|nr:MBL fold metallo-hydrolase [Desulfitobacterium sp.]